MKPPLYVRNLSEEERAGLRSGLKSDSGFRVRRSQMVLMSADEHLKPREIGERLGCQGQAVREAIHAFEVEGLGCLEQKAHRRKDDQRAFDEAGREALRQVVHHNPREYGYETSVWTLGLLAELSQRQGWVSTPVSPDTVGDTLKALGIRWRRAKRWISSPDPHYDTKKNDATG